MQDRPVHLLRPPQAPAGSFGPHASGRRAEALIRQAYDANHRVYGTRKIRRHLNRQGHSVARCTVERLMRELGITGAVRGKR
ncbi:IS3 family transposase [Streptomyces sp. NPDC052042]|uniref:IS3 family transposase n=1 Tax=Streptomyces sp. NPDC052042 TaxID=3365683 RepID=UPI0037D320DA